LFGALLAERVRNNYRDQSFPECIIPVPLHAQRLRERGFNQALELARATAKQLLVPVEWQSCRRIRATPAQSQLLAAQRAANLKNAFQIIKPFRHKHVAIIDDVVTTGHTVTELSKALQRAGVERIDVWCVARTIK